MTVTAKATITVPTADLRNALTAVEPHAEKHVTGGDNATLHRVRLYFGARELWVGATNGDTAAIGIVPIDEDDRSERFAADDGSFIVDVTPRQVELLLHQFKTSSGSGEDYDEYLELKATTSRLTVTDVGGLFKGESAAYPIEQPDTGFPDLPKLMGAALAERGSDSQAKPLVVKQPLLQLFRRAAVAYKHPLDFRATGSRDSRGFVVHCGPHFVGTVPSGHADDEFTRQSAAVYRTMLSRFVAGPDGDPGRALADAEAALDGELVDA